MSEQPTQLPTNPKPSRKPPNRPVTKPSPKPNPKPGGRPRPTPYVGPIGGKNVKVSFEVDGNKIVIEGTALFVKQVIDALFGGGALPQTVIARLKLVAGPQQSK